MEIPFKYVAFFVVLFIILCYLLYNTSIYNAQLKERLACKRAPKEDESSDDQSKKQVDASSDEKTVPLFSPKIENKTQKEQKKENLFTKGLKSYAAANDLEEVPKFL